MTRKIYNRHKESQSDHNARYMPTPEEIARMAAEIRAAKDGNGETTRARVKQDRDKVPGIRVCSTENFNYMPIGLMDIT